jgi:hypothetical protein
VTLRLRGTKGESWVNEWGKSGFMWSGGPHLAAPALGEKYQGSLHGAPHPSQQDSLSGSWLGTGRKCFGWGTQWQMAFSVKHKGHLLTGLSINTFSDYL